jgi:hypothetical protein
VPPRRKPNKVISKLVPQKARPWATVEERQSQVERLKLLGHQRTEIGRFLDREDGSVRPCEMSSLRYKVASRIVWPLV